MKNHLRSTAAILGFGLMTAGVIAPAFSQPRSSPPRQFNTQQVHYVRASISYTMCAMPTGTTCTVKVPAALPYNSMVIRVTVVLPFAFNSTTSDVLTLGTTQASANEIVSTGCNVHLQNQGACTVTNTASLATGAGATQTGTNGGFDLYIKWTAGAGNTATTGAGAMIIEYIPPNDGNCSATPLGATAPAC